MRSQVCSHPHYLAEVRSCRHLQIQALSQAHRTLMQGASRVVVFAAEVYLIDWLCRTSASPGIIAAGAVAGVLILILVPCIIFLYRRQLQRLPGRSRVDSSADRVVEQHSPLQFPGRISTASSRTEYRLPRGWPMAKSSTLSDVKCVLCLCFQVQFLIYR